MRYAELFAGAGGLSRGLDAAGWSCALHCEIEPHARAVLRHQWPAVPLHDDVTTLDGATLRGITLLSGGSPCQDLSVAGKRAGLGGARSSLFYHQVRVWEESGAPYLLWENVGGAFSSNRGRDFAAVLSALVGAAVAVPRDGWKRAGVAAGPTAVAAWRVFDLQHFGPPQRRVRVFVLAARAGGVDPAEVLALGEGVCGHPAPREQAREGVTGTLAGRTRGGGGLGTDFDLAGGVTVAFSTKETGGAASFGVVNTLRAESGDPHMGGRAAVIAFHHTQDPIAGAVSPAIGRTTDGMGVVAFSPLQGGRSMPVSDITPTLEAGTGNKAPAVVCTTGDGTHALTHEGADASEDGTGRGTPIVVGNSGMESWRTSDTAITLAARDAKGPNNVVIGTLDFGGHGGSYNGQDAYQNRIRADHGRPRRLTPRECERLMGWPDDCTRLGTREDGSVYTLSDTARYRLIGNGVGSPCAAWIGRRLGWELASQALERAA